MASTFELIIKPRKGWQPLQLRELWLHRDLFALLVWRDIQIRYKQTALGGLWAILQPLIGMFIFGSLFNRVAEIQSEEVPYSLFIFAGLVPWTFFQNSVGMSSNSLVGNENMIRKIYFPRVLVPLSQIIALGLDMLISLCFMAVLMLYYGWSVSPALGLLPILLVGSCIAAAGLGLTLSALNVYYRDVKYIVPFLVQMMFFLTPVLYPLSFVPKTYHAVLGLNPMAGIVLGFRSALLGSPIPWQIVGLSFGVNILLFTVGMVFFRRMERTFADVI
jgi:lipopolysaccharide transport system permease protein